MMTIKRYIRPIIIFAASVFFISSTETQNIRKEATLIGSIKEILNLYHFKPQIINDSLSKKAFDKYIKSLDYSKMYLTRSDYDLLKTYQFKIDDEIKSNTFNFFNLSYEIIDTKIDEVKGFYPEILSQKFNFELEEKISLDTENSEYVETKDELKELWRKSLKYQVLNKIILLESEQDKKKEKSDTVKLKTFDELEVEAREKVKKMFDSRFKRLEQINRQDRLSAYINSIINVYDPHTGYFPPKDKEDFDISISGKLEGIGATLSSRDGYIKVVQIVPGSASWRQGQLQAEDLILKVAQENEEPVDVVDMRLDEAVKLIRGPKGTKVILTVKKIDGSISEIPIIRDIVVLEETFAKSTVLTEKGSDKKIGYIYLPKFYVDFNDNKGRMCSDDIKKELAKLKKQNVEGIIFDLRNNGGGSLRDVVKICGYFIEKGPIVQVKSRNKNAEIQADLNSSIEYDGPLVVMVNSFSASASEIMAAAMQDYKRAVIVGSKSSYGKGTVQRFVDLDMFLTKDYADVKPLGHLKITIQKFYRINGGTTQLEGVSPDIILPDKYAYLEIGEKELEDALQWDEIPPATYETSNIQLNIQKLKKHSDNRLKKDTLMQNIEQAARMLKEQRDINIYSLNYSKYKEFNKKNKETSSVIKKIGKYKTPLEIIALDTADWGTTKLDTVKHQKVENWHSKLKKDEQLYETYRIIKDML